MLETVRETADKVMASGPYSGKYGPEPPTSTEDCCTQRRHLRQSLALRRAAAQHILALGFPVADHG